MLVLLATFRKGIMFGEEPGCREMTEIGHMGHQLGAQYVICVIRHLSIKTKQNKFLKCRAGRVRQVLERASCGGKRWV